jgi:colanic acid/amylovoran biosynthesis glycosyltransferase
VACDAGWVVPMGKTDMMATRLAALSQDPGAVTAKAAKALSFAREHDFDTEFALRMSHFARYARG